MVSAAADRRVLRLESVVHIVTGRKPSPRYIDERDYQGGLSQDDIAPPEIRRYVTAQDSRGQPASHRPLPRDSVPGSAGSVAANHGLMEQVARHGAPVVRRAGGTTLRIAYGRLGSAAQDMVDAAQAAVEDQPSPNAVRACVLQRIRAGTEPDQAFLRGQCSVTRARALWPHGSKPSSQAGVDDLFALAVRLVEAGDEVVQRRFGHQ